ncbi:MAG TPA: type II toxin-antitoxin system VapC family toxin [Candidatus Kapabacteria bacterium]|jgi:PIN domain nuclease of toxin-antitoxin system
MNFLFDACALIAYVRNERGGTLVGDILLDPTAQFFIHAVNLCEVYYDFIRVAGEQHADRIVQDTLSYGIKVIEQMDADLWKKAGIYKATLKKLSLADCFALATAKRLNATLVTSDHKEFDKVAALDICKILFNR